LCIAQIPNVINGIAQGIASTMHTQSGFRVFIAQTIGNAGTQRIKSKVFNKILFIPTFLCFPIKRVVENQIVDPASD